jgi:hypothetical protein
LINGSCVEPNFLRKPPQTNDNNSSTEYPPICDDAPSTNIDPEKCCHFPNFFEDSIVQKCEEENGLTDKSIISDMVTDSVSSEMESVTNVVE